MLETVITSILTSAVTATAAWLMQKGRLRRDFELDRERIRTEFVAEQVAKELLQSDEWKKRTFEAIERRLGGFEKDELRKILVRTGAVRFEGQEGKELWGLLTRNKDEL